MNVASLSPLLKLLPVVGPIVAATEGFKQWYDEAAGALRPADQATAKDAYADLIADNDEGHDRLQRKLQAAAQAGGS